MAPRIQFCLSVLILVGKFAQYWGYGHWQPRNWITQQPASQVFLCVSKVTIRVRCDALGALLTPAASAGQKGVCSWGGGVSEKSELQYRHEITIPPQLGWSLQGCEVNAGCELDSC